MKLDEITITISPDVLDMLQKIRKNSTGFLNLKKLEQILSVLPNWKMEKSIVSFPVDYLGSHNDTRNHFIKDFPDLDIMHRSDGNVSIFDQSGNNPHVVEIAFDAIKKLSNKPKVGEYHIENLTKTSPKSFSFRYMISSKGAIVTAPDGKQCLVGKEHRMTVVNIGLFTKWALNTSFMQDVLTILGQEAYDPKAVKVRTDDNVGTCPVCFAMFKMKNGQMVLHGYNRPGHGYIHGECYGVKYEPFEKSNRGTKNYLDILTNMLDTKNDSLKQLDVAESVTVLNRHQKLVTIDKADPKFVGALNAKKQELHAVIYQINQDIKMYKEKIKNWKEVDLP